MSYPRALALVVAALVGSAWLPESAKAQSNPYALDRLFLDPSDNTPLYGVLSFDSVTEVANYYGRGSLEESWPRNSLPATAALPPICSLRGIRIYPEERISTEQTSTI